MTNPYFLDRVAREATHCAKAVDELAKKLRGLDPAGEKLAEDVIDTLIKLAYDAMAETQPIEINARNKKKKEH